MVRATLSQLPNYSCVLLAPVTTDGQAESKPLIRTTRGNIWHLHGQNALLTINAKISLTAVCCAHLILLSKLESS